MLIYRKIVRIIFLTLYIAIVVYFDEILHINIPNNYTTQRALDVGITSEFSFEQRKLVTTEFQLNFDVVPTSCWVMTLPTPNVKISAQQNYKKTM